MSERPPLLDRLVAAVSPERALKRATARMALEALRGFDVQQKTRYTRGWKRPATSQNGELSGNLPGLRNAARDLVRNNPYAARAVEIVVAHQVGYGIQARPMTGSAPADRRVKQLWQEWVAETAFDDLQVLVARARAESGEVLVRKRYDNAGRVPLRFEVLEADLLDHQKHETRVDGTRIVLGVELDAAGRTSAYWLLPRHPGDVIWPLVRRDEHERVLADQILHVFRRLRPHQIRGLPDLTPSMLRLRALDDYEEAELQRALVQACVAVFVESASPATGPMAGTLDPVTGRRTETIAPGRIERMLPGEKASFLSPAGNTAYADHRRSVLHAIAVGFGVTYHQLTGDLRDANYSSLRAGNIEFRRLTELIQWRVLIPQFLQPAWSAFIDAAVMAGALPFRRDRYPVEWVPAAFEAVDPLKDAQAIGEELRLRLTSPQKAIAGRGYDPNEIMADWQAWAGLLAAAGLAQEQTPVPTPAEPGAETTEED